MRQPRTSFVYPLPRRIARLAMIVGALIGFCCSAAPATARPLTTASPILPTNEDDEAGHASEGLSAHERGNTRPVWSSVPCRRQPLIRPHAHTPSTGFETADFRPPPDHFRNGIGTPLRC